MKTDDKILKVRVEVAKTLDAMSKNYGFPAVRAACNRYLKTRQEQSKARKQIAQLERELGELKAKV